MMKLLNRNCVMPKRKTPFQVPWGKHNPVDFRGEHFAKSSKGQVPENFLPVVIIKDVVTWVNSMCKNPYAAHWARKYKCPQLVKEDLSPVPVEIKFQEEEVRLCAERSNELKRRATELYLVARFSSLRRRLQHSNSSLRSSVAPPPIPRFSRRRSKMAAPPRMLSRHPSRASPRTPPS